MTDSSREAQIDKRVQRRLATDSAYRNAENAEEQAVREAEIEWEEDEEACDKCGAYLPDDEGDGYDGYCGTCADKLEAKGHWS